ncbi:hypothetical protein CCP2SC5_740025 [Azospirillaceae bacterium]
MKTSTRDEIDGQLYLAVSALREARNLLLAEPEYTTPEAMVFFKESEKAINLVHAATAQLFRLPTT